MIFQTYKITNTTFGTLYALATLLSAVALPFLGPLIDRVDVRKYCLGVFVGLLGGVVLLFNTNLIFGLFISIFLLRLFGQGLCTHINGVCTARYFGSNRGKALSLTNIGFPLAEGLFTPLVAILIGVYGELNTTYFLALILMSVYLPSTFFITKKNRIYNHGSSQGEFVDCHTNKKSWTPRQVLRHKIFYLLIVHSVFPAFSLSGFLIYQTAYTQAKAWPVQTIAFSMSLFAIGRLLSSFVIGPLVDKLGAVKLFPFYQVPLTLAFLVLWGFSDVSSSYVGLFLCGLTVGAAAPIKSSLWAELYGIEHLGAIKSLFATIIVVVTSISPLFFGWMVDQEKHLQLLLLLSVMSLITTLVGTWAVYRLSFSKNFSDLLPKS